MELYEDKLIDRFGIDEGSRYWRIISEDIPGVACMSPMKFDEILDRLDRGEPIQYITGKAHFYGLVFDVNDDVLIPRPETEELVFAVEKYIATLQDKAIRIIDLGTGSGIIPITLKHLFDEISIDAMDVSFEALDVANVNAKKHRTDVNFFYGDMLNPYFSLPDTYDVLVSNPPYIPYSQIDVMSQEVIDYEPHLALFADDDDGLEYYNAIVNIATNYLKPKGKIFIELNEFRSEAISRIFQKIGNVVIHKDMQGKDRILEVSLCQ